MRGAQRIPVGGLGVCDLTPPFLTRFLLSNQRKKNKQNKKQELSFLLNWQGQSERLPRRLRRFCRTNNLCT